MTVRDDISVRWDLSPRLITIAAPSTEITIQDLHDTLREREQRVQNMIYPSIVSTAGKESLGGGVFVGLTMTLIDACISFESRYTRTSSGTATSPDATGEILIDTSATFILDGVTRGATVTNFTDQSYSTVIQVIGEIELQLEPLADGIANDWTSGDAYKVHNEIQVNIAGGNLVAVDGYGAAIDPVCPTAFTQVVRSSASQSTSLNSADIEFSSFDGSVTLDPTNKTGKAVSGTLFPTGTPRQPSNNLTDTLLIAVARGFAIIYLRGSVTIANEDVSSCRFIGESAASTDVVVGASATVINSEFANVNISGDFDGYVLIENSRIGNITMVSGIINTSDLRGTITLNGGEFILISCFDGIAGFGTPTIDFNGGGTSGIIRGYQGGLLIRNKTGPEDVSIDLVSGRLILDSTITDGGFIVRGIGQVTDNTTGSTTVDDQNLVNPNAVGNVTRNKLIPFLDV